MNGKKKKKCLGDGNVRKQKWLDIAPIAGSRTACAACSSLTGVFSHIFLSFSATGESESSAWATRYVEEKNIAIRDIGKQNWTCLRMKCEKLSLNQL